MKSFSEKQLTQFSIMLSASLFVKNVKRILTVDPELWPSIIFGPKMAHLPWGRFFWEKTIEINIMYLLVPLIVQNFKQSVRAEPELCQSIIFGPKMAQLPQLPDHLH